MPSTASTSLPQKYYLSHARELFDFVRLECSHLLDKHHLDYLQRFNELDENSQCLLIRCLARKPKFIKRASLSYPEIDSLSSALNTLLEQEFLALATPSDWPNLATALTKPELLALVRLYGHAVKSSVSRQEVVEFSTQQLDASHLTDADLLNNFVVRRQSQTVDYIFFLFFGDLRNRFQKFAMRDLGVLRTRKSNSKPVARFEQADDAYSAFELQQLRRSFQADPQATQEAAADYLLSKHPVGFAAQQTHSKLLLEVGNELLSQNADRALQLWRTSNEPQAVEKWVRETHRQGDRSALKVELETLREKDLPASCQVFIEDFYARKYQGKRTSVYTDLVREPTRALQLDEAYINDVEDGVIEHYQRQGISAQFSENKCWRALFALTFWELLFGEQEINYGEFDRLPPLLRNGQFYQSLETRIEQILLGFDDPQRMLKSIARCATINYGQPNGIFRWRANLLDLLKPCVLHSPPTAIAQVLRRMAMNYQHARDGYPDLLVVENSELRFEEIKAPGDSLRPNQLVSINRLRRAGYRVDISQVHWSTNPDQVYAVVDIETTGSMKGGNAITEVAVVQVRGGNIISEWSTLVNPQRRIPAYITRLTHIDDAMVANAPVFAEIADQLRDQLRDCIFVAHNVGFDYGFIKAAYEAIGQSFRKPKYCTVRNSRKAFPGLKSYSLGALTTHFDIDLVGAHRALNDARATAHLLRLIQDQNASC
ncbi:exonuclease domain-containing protein [Arenicella xantha]|nr:exonuclease domain-containing protein [Arenicella xantha]